MKSSLSPLLNANSHIPRASVDVVDMLLDASVVRIIQFTPEWAIFVYINYLRPAAVVIENAPSPISNGMMLPLLVHGSKVVSGNAYTLLTHPSIHPILN
jgi:hypothetical protein